MFPSLEFSQNLQKEYSNLIRINTMNFELNASGSINPLKIKKNYISLNDETLEESSPRSHTNKLSFSFEKPYQQTFETLLKELKFSSFDFSNFKHLKILMHVLKKNTLLRTKEEIDFLANVFSYIGFFQSFQKEFDNETYDELLKKLRYEYGKKDKKIFNYGDMGRKFYIILNGEVSVLVPPNEKTESQEKEDSNEDERIKKKKEFVKVNVLKTGDSFGEIALLNLVPRTATCICSQDTHFVVLTAEMYLKIVANYHKNKFRELIDMLDRSQYFKTWPNELKNVMALHFKLQALRRGTVLYKENDVINKLYLIKSGEIEISQKIPLEKKKNIKITIRDDIRILQNSQLEKPIIEKNDSSSLNFERKTLCLLGPLEIFGEDGLFTTKIRTCKAEIKSNDALIYEIPIKKLLENIPREFINGIVSQNQWRWQWRNNLLKKSKTTTNVFEKQKTQPLYQTTSLFKKEEDLIKHINEKNHETLKGLPATFNFDYRNKKFFHGIEKHYPLQAETERKSDIERAIFPDTILIPFKKKIQALSFGLRHFRVSPEFKEKLQNILKENTEKNQENIKKKENVHIDELFSEYEEIEEKDLLDAFLQENDKETLNKKKLKKIESPLLFLSKILGLNLKFLTDLHKKPTAENSEEVFSNNHLFTKQNIYKMNDSDKNKFFNHKKKMNSMAYDPTEKILRNTMKNKTFVSEKISTVNISKVLNHEENNKDSYYGSRAFLERNSKMKRKNIKRPKENQNFYGKPRKLVFITEDSGQD